MEATCGDRPLGDRAGAQAYSLLKAHGLTHVALLPRPLANMGFSLHPNSKEEATGPPQTPAELSATIRKISPEERWRGLGVTE